MNKNIADYTDRFRLHLVLACDIIMLSAVCMALCYALFVGLTYFLIWLGLNAITMIVFRHWLYYSLQIPWLSSHFNRALKRFADIILSTAYILTLLPLIFVVQALVTKRKSGGPVLSFRQMRIGEGKPFIAMLFCNKSVWDIRFLNYSPIAFNILVGTLSIWDLSMLQECKENEASPGEATNDLSEEDNHTGIPGSDRSLVEN